MVGNNTDPNSLKAHTGESNDNKLSVKAPASEYNLNRWYQAKQQQLQNSAAHVYMWPQETYLLSAESIGQGTSPLAWKLKWKQTYGKKIQNWKPKAEDCPPHGVWVNLDLSFTYLYKVVSVLLEVQ